MDISKDLTRDGTPIHPGLINFVAGSSGWKEFCPVKDTPTFYCLARMAEPDEKVTVLDFEPKASSLIDGEPLIRYIVENHRGDRFMVEPWQLSRLPPDELYRKLREKAEMASAAAPAGLKPMVVPVVTVRLAG
jgi:hypothetical protein